MTDQLTCTITRDCQIACLASLLTRPTFDALMAGMVSQDDSPATVGQLVELYQYDKLTDIFNIGSSRSGEIRWALVQADSSRLSIIHSTDDHVYERHEAATRVVHHPVFGC